MSSAEQCESFGMMQRLPLGVWLRNGEELGLMGIGAY
jgi:hypothetical protein